MSKEIWKDVVEWEGWYQVSSVSRVQRIRASQGAQAGRILSSFDYGGGYLAVVLSKPGKRKLVYTHILVLEAFVGPRPYGYESHHENENKKDNRLSNLEWVTPSKHHRVLHPTDFWARKEELTS